MASDENFWPQARAALETRSWKSPSARAWKFCRVRTLFNVIHVFDPNWSPGWSNSKFNNTLKTNDINNNIQNHDNRMMIILQKWKIVYRHIQGWTICSLAVYHWFGCQSVYNARANKRHRYRIFDCDTLFYFIYFMGNRLYINVIICKYLFLVLWKYTSCLNFSFGESRFAVLSVQWHHISVMVSQITVSSTVCSTCPG